MENLDNNAIASINFAIDYQSALGSHTDIYHAHPVNFWRDILPENFRNKILSAGIDKPVHFSINPGELLPAYEPRNHLDLKRYQFDNRSGNGVPVAPKYGRFYPRGRLKGVSGIFPENILPFRCVNVGDNSLEADLNHPLADQSIQIEANVLEKKVKPDERGGTCIDWIETITTGSGMQARVNGTPTAFFEKDAFGRQDERPDSEFYGQPRFVQHIDAKADEIITGLYGRLLQPGMKILDLMTSWVSHIPVDLDLGQVNGLGMNRVELAANPQLNATRVHDLNQNPLLPYDNARYNAVVCSVSVEYLIRPFDVFKEVARVLESGGLFVTTFSNRWFAPKAIRIWPQIHEFERMGLVMEYFADSGEFTDLKTLSVRGFPRPYEDKYFPQLLYADPVYAVWGRKK